MTGTATTCWQLMVFATCAATSGYFGCKNVELLPFVAKGGGGGGCDNPGLFITEMWNGPPIPPRACNSLDFMKVYLKLGTSMISNHFWIGVGPTMSNGGGGVVRGEDDAADCCRKALYRASRTARIPRQWSG